MALVAYACFCGAAAIAAYVLIAGPVFLLPGHRRLIWNGPQSQMKMLADRYRSSPTAASGWFTHSGVGLDIVGLAMGMLASVALPAPGWLRRRRYGAWRREVLTELGDAVEYLELHFAAGATVPDAIAGTAAFLVGPLAGELRRVLARAALLQDGSRALDELAERLADPDLTAVARRLSAAWRLRAPGPETFAGFGDTLRHIRETHIAARTKTLPVAYVAIAGWMLFALVAIVAVPAGMAFLHSLSSF